MSAMRAGTLSSRRYWRTDSVYDQINQRPVSDVTMDRRLPEDPIRMGEHVCLDVRVLAPARLRVSPIHDRGAFSSVIMKERTHIRRKGHHPIFPVLFKSSRPQQWVGVGASLPYDLA